MLLALVPALIVIPQPDLGTGLVYVAVAFTILFVAGTSWKQLTALVAMFAVSVAIVLAGAPALGVHVLKPYQVQRLTGFLNPSHDPQNQTYNITESLIAIGSGRRRGAGFRAPRRPISTSSRRTRPTSSSPSSARPMGSPARRWCCRCTPC